jgi:hypothetical protein
MLLHWNICIEWFELNSKGNSKSFCKMLWKIGKGKRKGFSMLISVLAQQPSASPPGLA